MNNNSLDEKIFPHSAQALRESRALKRGKEQQERFERKEDLIAANSMLEKELKTVVREMHTQNAILAEQAYDAKKAAIKAESEAKKSRIIAYISLGVAIIMPIIIFILEKIF